MKLLILSVLLICSTIFAQPQTARFSTRDAFKSTAESYNAAIDTSGGFYGLWIDSIRTVYSTHYNAGRSLRGGENALIHARRDTIASPDTITLEMGLWRGESYNSGAGYEYKHLATWGLGGGDKLINLSDSTWWTKQITDQWIYRFQTTGAADTSVYFLDQFFNIAK